MTFHESVNTDINRWVYKGVNYFQYYMIETLEKIFFDPYDDKKDMTDSLNSKDKEAFEEFKKEYEKFVSSDQQVSELHAGIRDHRQQRQLPQVSLRPHRGEDSALLLHGQRKPHR